MCLLSYLATGKPFSIKNKKDKGKGRAKGHTPVIPAPGRWQQEDRELKVFPQASHSPVLPLKPHYSNPLVAAKLLNVPKNTEVLIVCKILADHVTFDNPHDPYEGKVEFKLTIQK